LPINDQTSLQKPAPGGEAKHDGVDAGGSESCTRAVAHLYDAWRPHRASHSVLGLALPNPVRVREPPTNKNGSLPLN